ncbi:hypothetical protein ES708_34874 [subsurface metagenome]
MKADLYVQGHFWATIDVPGDSLLTLLASGMITEAQQRAAQLEADLNAIDGVQCSIHIRYHHLAPDIPDTEAGP